ncbi:MAG TPA: glycosyltransferase family 2 protein [Thermomicrobiales bacterium]|nr:glycosyltransferase family 2 protein [Thermomicrobiales bacterium]
MTSTSTSTATTSDSETTTAPLVSVVSGSVSDIGPARGPISVVIPVMNEEGNLSELHERLTTVLATTGVPWEILFIDDGSSDGTWREITRLRAGDPHVVAIQHRRNFGKAQALANGFALASGNTIITMDGDLQDDPGEIPRMLATLNDGYDLVSGWKQHRQDPRGKTAPSKLFNWTVRRVTGVELHDFNCGFKAYRREVTDTIRVYGELHRFTPVLASAEGFRIAELPVKHHARAWGKSKYGLKRLFKGFLDLITVFFLTNYRQRPMHLFGVPGIISVALGVLMGLKLSWDRLVNDETIGTRPLLLLAVLLIVVGVQFFGLGLLGEFLVQESHRPKTEPARFLRRALGIGSGFEGSTRAIESGDDISLAG